MPTFFFPVCVSAQARDGSRGRGESDLSSSFLSSFFFFFSESSPGRYWRRQRLKSQGMEGEGEGKGGRLYLTLH